MHMKFDPYTILKNDVGKEEQMLYNVLGFKKSIVYVYCMTKHNKMIQNSTCTCILCMYV